MSWHETGYQGPRFPGTTEVIALRGPRHEIDPSPCRPLFPLLAQLPMSMEIMAPPLDEPILIRIAPASEATARPRRPPLDLGPMEGEP